MDTKRKRCSKIKPALVVGNTANRTAKFTAGEFAVVKTSENLVYDLTAGPNTTVTGNTGEEVVNFATANALTHGAFDHKNANVLKAAEDGKSITGYYALTSTSAPSLADLKVTDIRNQSGEDTGDVYAAATWQVDFKLTFGQNKKNVGLFIDWSKTSFARPVTLAENQVYPADTVLYTDALLSQAAGTLADNDDNDDTSTHIITAADLTSYNAEKYYINPLATGKGFRIAFTPIGTNASSGKTRVLAKQQSTTNAKYVYVASPSAASDYTAVMNSGTAYEANDHDLLASDTAAGNILTLAGYVDDSKTTAEALAYNNYLGIFPFTANTEVTLSFMCVAWYEGTDPEIQNRATAEEYEKMTAELAFEAINLADAA